MADNQRSPNTLLTKRVTDNARNIQFIQMAKLLNSIADNQAPTEEEASAIGDVLYRANPSLGFPSSDIDSVILSPYGHYEVTVNFMGLYGPASPLPVYYTEAVIAEGMAKESEDADIFYIKTMSELKALRDHQLDVEKATSTSLSIKKSIKAGVLQSTLIKPQQLQELLERQALEDIFSESELEGLRAGTMAFEVHTAVRTNQADFFDLFNHKFIEMYLQASLKYRPHEVWQSKEQKNYIELLYSLIGAPLRSEREESALKWERLLPLVGLLGVNRSAPEIIRKVISKYFAFKIDNVEVEEAIERRALVPQDQLFVVGKQGNLLGDETILGLAVIDKSHKFRVHLRFLSVLQYQNFCPYGSGVSAGEGASGSYQELYLLLQYLSAANQIFDVCLHLQKEEVIPFVLLEDSDNCLGFSTWLGERKDIEVSTIIQ